MQLGQHARVVSTDWRFPKVYYGEAELQRGHWRSAVDRGEQEGPRT